MRWSLNRLCRPFICSVLVLGPLTVTAWAQSLDASSIQASSIQSASGALAPTGAVLIAQAPGVLPQDPAVTGTWPEDLPRDPALRLPDFEPLPTREGYVAWATLAEVGERPRGDTVVPDFSADILALSNQTIRIEGFMLPLQTGDRHTHFLLSASPGTCYFCLPGGPAEFIEVRVRRPLAYTTEPVRLSGRLQVLDNDPMGVFYRMSDAEPSRDP